MIVGPRDGAKLIGVTIVGCTAVFVCALFLNYYMDVAGLRGSVGGEALALYEAQVAMAKMICGISGGCLSAVAAVMLTFYIKLYIDERIRELGILKAMGYSRGRLAASFWPFGLSVLTGAAFGFAGASAAMPTVYAQLCGEELPSVAVSFRPSLIAYTVLLPAAAFSALSVAYAYVRLNRPVSEMLKGNDGGREAASADKRRRKTKTREKDVPFLKAMRRSVIRSKKAFAFFVAFAGFCFSAMVQMGLSMRRLSTGTMGGMILTIGLVLAFTSFFMAVTALVAGNAKSISVMKAFGYSVKSCSKAVFSGYRPFAYLGFVAGTLYQYGLLRLMVNVFFKDVGYVPDYSFDFPVFFAVSAIFILLYEGAVRLYSLKLNKISVKMIMDE